MTIKKKDRKESAFTSAFKVSGSFFVSFLWDKL